MKRNDAKEIAIGLTRLSESCVDAAASIRSTARTVQGTKKLWQERGHSPLIKLGVALIAFPDPTISDIVGSAMVAAGLVQEGIRRRALHVDGVAKAFHETMRELHGMRGSV